MTKDEVLKEVLDCPNLSSDSKIYIIQNLGNPATDNQQVQNVSYEARAMFNAIKDIELTNPVGGLKNLDSFSPILSLHKNLDTSETVSGTEIIEED